MLKQKKLILIVIPLVTLIAVHWFYLTPPKDFPSNEQILYEINSSFSQSRAYETLDIIKLDNKNVFVPFKTETGEYAISLWIWKHHKWKIGMIELSGEPRILKIKSNDPSSYHIVWNLHPKDRIDRLYFYLKKDRHYMVSDGKHTYDPRIEMNERVSLAKQAYGTFSLPDNWVSILEDFKDVQSKMTPNLFDNFFQQRGIFFGWLPQDQNGSIKYPERSVNGNGWGTGDVQVDYLMLMSEYDLQE